MMTQALNVSSITATRRELEDLWRDRLREARLRYEQAGKAFRETWGEHFEWRLSADPTLAIQKARKAENEALIEYMRVLRIFTDLVLYGKRPEEPSTGGPSQP